MGGDGGDGGGGVGDVGRENFLNIKTTTIIEKK